MTSFLKGVISRFALCILFLLPTLVFLDVGIAWVNCGYPERLLAQPPKIRSVLPSIPELEMLAGSCWRVALAFFICGFFLVPKNLSLRATWKFMWKVILTNLIVGVGSLLVWRVIAGLQVPQLSVFEYLATLLFSSWAAEHFSICGTLSDPFLSFPLQCLVFPIFTLLGKIFSSRVIKRDLFLTQSNQSYEFSFPQLRVKCARKYSPKSRHQQLLMKTHSQQDQDKEKLWYIA